MVRKTEETWYVPPSEKEIELANKWYNEKNFEWLVKKIDKAFDVVSSWPEWKLQNTRLDEMYSFEIRDKILEEIKKERLYQIDRWGIVGDDQQNNPGSWVTYITSYVSSWLRGKQVPPYQKEDVDRFREAMIKTAAIALAAVESLDRQKRDSGKPHYQED